MNENEFDFGARLRHIRKMRGMMQEDIADIIGISLRNYQYYERGEHRLPITTLYNILHVLDISADYFFGLTLNPDSHKTGSNSWESFDFVANAEKTEREIGENVANIRSELFKVIRKMKNDELRSEIKDILRNLEETSMLSESNARTLRSALSQYLKD